MNKPSLPLIFLQYSTDFGGEKGAAWGCRKLRFERIASTAAVRTRGDFGIIPSPYDVDGERKTPVNIAIKTDKLKHGI